jgi:hypothetical protein
MILYVFFITVFVVFLAQQWIKREKFYSFCKDMPSAKNYGLLGHGPHFLGKNDIGVFASEICKLVKFY